MGAFIVVEGLDGSGKSTLIQGLSRYIGRLGFKVVVTSEPTDGPIGRVIKNYLREAQERDPVYEALLFAADRRWHCENVIKPALEADSIVLCDRYVFSSLAYQATAGLDREWVLSINKFAIKPDLAFLLDAPPEVCKRRLAARSLSILERGEAQKAAYDAYLKLARSGALVRIDATADKNIVLERAIEVLRERRILQGV